MKVLISRAAKSATMTVLAFVVATAAHAQYWNQSGTSIYNNNTGNVGIGVTAPNTVLQVGGDVSASQFASNGGQISIKGSTAPAKQIHLGFETQNNYGFLQTLNSGVSWASYNLALQPQGGSVVIGTGAAPLAKLDVAGDLNVGGNTSATNQLQVSGDVTATQFSANGGQLAIKAKTASTKQVHVGFESQNNYAFVQTLNYGVSWGAYDLSLQPLGGKVGIGVTHPQAALDVNGSINVNGNINAKFQDVAEWVPAAAPMKPGTVVVLNRAHTNEVIASTRSYDTAVAGVVSAQPGLVLGEASPSKEKIATTGRVRVRVDATKHRIDIGDLLVTSDKSGTAMYSEPMEINGRQFHQPGTVIGKALEPLASGEGEILVLLSLQ